MIFLNVFCVLGSGCGVFLLVSSCPPPTLSAGSGLGNQATLLWRRTRFLSFWAGFGVVPAYFALPIPRVHCRAVVWVIGPLNCGTGLSVVRVIFFSVLPIPPSLGAGGDLGILTTPTVPQDCVTSWFSLFRRYNFASPPSLRWR